MKFLALISLVVCSAVKIQSLSGNIDDPLSWCGGESPVLSLTNVVLTPYPLIAGEDFFMKVIGRLRTNITHGSTANIVAKLGPITVLKTDLDLCNELQCPIVKDDDNDQSITIKQTILSNTPRGKLGITIKVTNGDGSEVACLEGKLIVVRV